MMLGIAGLIDFFSLGEMALLPDDFHNGRTYALMCEFKQFL